jgi:hypothetical protein
MTQKASQKFLAPWSRLPRRNRRKVEKSCLQPVNLYHRGDHRLRPSKTGHRGDHRLQPSKTGHKGNHRTLSLNGVGQSVPVSRISKSSSKDWIRVAMQRRSGRTWCPDGFNQGYQSVKRFANKIRPTQVLQARPVIVTAPGEDYGEFRVMLRSLLAVWFPHCHIDSSSSCFP